MTPIEEFAAAVGEDVKKIWAAIELLKAGGTPVNPPSVDTNPKPTPSVPEPKIIEAEPYVPKTMTTDQELKVDGMKGYFFGDSLTEVNYRTNNGYLKYLANEYGIDGVNKGVSGTGYSTRFLSEHFESEEVYDADFIYIAMGVNDFWNVSKFNVPLIGKGGMKDLSGMTGFIYHTLKAAAYASLGTKPVIVQTPLPILIGKNGATFGGGYTYDQLVNQIRAVATEVNKFFGNVYLFDLYATDPLHILNSELSNGEIIAKYYTQGDAVDNDGVHPNDAGWKIINGYIANYLVETLSEAVKPDSYSIYEPKYSTNEAGKEVINFGVLAYPTKETKNTWYRFYFTQELKDSKKVMYLYNLLNTHKYNIKVEFPDGTVTQSNASKMGEKWYIDIMMYTEENKTDNMFYKKLFGDNEIIYQYDKDSLLNAYIQFQKTWWDSMYVNVTLTEK